MVKTLSILHCANPDPNLHFLLLGDFRDSLTGSFSDDGEIVSAAAEAIRALRESTGHDFFYLQRERIYHAPIICTWAGSCKRGSLNTLLKLIQGEPVEDRFAYASVPAGNAAKTAIAMSSQWAAAPFCRRERRCGWWEPCCIPCSAARWA